jgi:glyceraldehyde 3-phosphate dehydrogenase
MTIRVGINGFGRIGRNLFRAAKKAGADIDFVAGQRPGLVETMAHLLKYDSVLGRSTTTSRSTADGIKVEGDTSRSRRARPQGPAWADLGRRRGRRVDRLLHQPRARPRPTSTRAPRS